MANEFNDNVQATVYGLRRAYLALADTITMLGAARIAGRNATNDQALSGDAVVALTHLPTLISHLTESLNTLDDIKSRVLGIPDDTDTDE